MQEAQALTDLFVQAFHCDPSQSRVIIQHEQTYLGEKVVKEKEYRSAILK